MNRSMDARPDAGSSTGVLIRQDACHGAQKPGNTATLAGVSASNDASSAVVIQGSTWLHQAHRGVPGSRGGVVVPWPPDGVRVPFPAGERGKDGDYTPPEGAR
ncbi:MAG: hypothetical protein ACTHQQ_02880 [Solirubrobacteraceae bacterium]